MNDRISCSCSDSEVAAPPASSSFGAVGSSSQTASGAGSSQQHENNTSYAHTASHSHSQSDSVARTARAAVSTPGPAPVSPPAAVAVEPTLDSPQEAQAANAASSSSGHRLLPTPTDNSSSSPGFDCSSSNRTPEDNKNGRISLIDHIHDIMLDHLQQHFSPEALQALAASVIDGNGASSSSSSTDQLRLMTRQLMSADSLLNNQDRYLWLNHELHGVQVRTHMRLKSRHGIIDHKGIAWLEHLKPADVYHNVYKPEDYPNAAAAVAAVRDDGKISCSDHLKAKHSVDLKGPDLPCIAVKLSDTACKGVEGLEDQFIHYPLELCSVTFTADGSPKRDVAPQWNFQTIDALCDAATPNYTAAVPEWVAALLKERFRQMQVTAAATADQQAATYDGVSAGNDQAAGDALDVSANEVQPHEPAAAAAGGGPSGIRQLAEHSSSQQMTYSMPADNTTGLQPATMSSSSSSSSSSASANSSALAVCSYAQTPNAYRTTTAETAAELLAASSMSAATSVLDNSIGVTNTTTTTTTTTSNSSSTTAATSACTTAETATPPVGVAAYPCSLLATFEDKTTTNGSSNSNSSSSSSGNSVDLQRLGSSCSVAAGCGVEGVQTSISTSRTALDMDSGSSSSTATSAAAATGVTSLHSSHALYNKLGAADPLQTYCNDTAVPLSNHAVPRWGAAAATEQYHASTPAAQAAYGSLPSAAAAAAGRYATTQDLQRQHPVSVNPTPAAAAAAAVRQDSSSVMLPQLYMSVEPAVHHMCIAGSTRPSSGYTPVTSSEATATAATAVYPFEASGRTAAVAEHMPAMQLQLQGINPAPAVLHASCSDAAAVVTAAGANHPSLVANAAASAAAAAAACAGSHPLIVMDPVAAGMMVATIAQQLQKARPVLPQQQQQQQQQESAAVGSSVTADVPRSSTHGSREVHQCTAVGALQTSDQLWHQALPPSPITAAAAAETRAAAETEPAASTSNPQPSTSGCIGQGHTRPSSSSSRSGGGSICRPSFVQEGFLEVMNQLVPTEQEKKDMKGVLDALCVSLHCVDGQQNPVEWRVAEVIRAGSFEKKTSLRGMSDLDVVVKLKCYHGPFHQCRCKLLQAVAAHLCRSDHTNSSRSPGCDTGWLLKPCVIHYFLKLHHVGLGVDLDVQVAEHSGSKDKQKEVELDRLLQRAAQLKDGASSSQGIQNNSNPARQHFVPADSLQAKAYRTRQSIGSSRERVTNLTELMKDVVTGVDKRMKKDHGVDGMGCLCSRVIRVMKAWAKSGLPKAPAAAAAEPAIGPPGYILEIFVVHVLEQGLSEGRKYDQSKPLQFFKDVLKAASTQLSSTSKKSEAIMVTLYYSREEGMMKEFQDEWGPEGWPYSPYIISPVDPTYNCSEYAPFRDYDVLAAAAGELLQQMVKAEKMGAGGWSWLCENSAIGSVALDFGVQY